MDLDTLAHDVADWLRELGPAGPLALFVLFVVQCIVAPLPSEPLMMAAGFVYGPRLGGFVGWLGVVVGACACFALARVYGRPVVERFVRAKRLADLDRFVEGRSERRVAARLARLARRDRNPRDPRSRAVALAEAVSFARDYLGPGRPPRAADGVTPIQRLKARVNEGGSR